MVSLYLRITHLKPRDGHSAAMFIPCDSNQVSSLLCSRRQDCTAEYQWNQDYKEIRGQETRIQMPHPGLALLWLKSDPSVKGMQTQKGWKLKATLLSQTPRVKGVKLMSLREFDSLGGGAVKNWQDTNISGGRKQRIKESKALPIEVKLPNQETKFHSLLEAVAFLSSLGTYFLTLLPSNKS